MGSNAPGRFGMSLTSGIVLVAAALAISWWVASERQAWSAPKRERGKQIYDPDADAKADIATAVKRARQRNRHVLVIYGGNWCVPCYKLHDMLEKNRTLARLMTRYETVSVDIGEFDRNLDISEGYGVDLKEKSVPFLTVLDGEGNVVKNQNASEFEGGGQYNATKIATFLRRWMPKRR